MKQATYDVANIGHFGLASKAYLHFTSPIRRYPDLVVHRVVHQSCSRASRDATTETREQLAEAALASSIAERRAMEVEREIVDLYRAFFMKDHIGERFEGTVTAVVGSGLFVQLDAPFVDVLVRLEDLGHDHWEVDDDALRVVAARSGDVVALGDRLLVEVTDAAILRRTVYARRVGAEPASPRRTDEKRGARPRSLESNGKPQVPARGRADRGRRPGGAPTKAKKTAGGGKGNGKGKSKKGRRR